MKVCFVSKDQTIQNHSLQYTLLFDLNLCIPAEEEVIVSIIKECLLLCFRIYSIPETFKGKPLSQRGKKILHRILGEKFTSCRSLQPLLSSEAAGAAKPQTAALYPCLPIPSPAYPQPPPWYFVLRKQCLVFLH